MSTSQDPNSVRRGRRQLLALAALFFVPLAVAFWLYYGPSHWRPAGGTNQGEIIDPARPLPRVSLEKADGTQTGDQFLSGKWTMVYVGDGACGPDCRKALYLTRQSRIALNKDMDRLQRVFLVTQRCCDRRYLAAEHPDLLVARLDSPAGAQLLQAFPEYTDVPGVTNAAGRIYLVDPLGNLMMSYPRSAPNKALLTDLKKLLRLSHIG
jgi:cytochrome oxidase Cu insertion factor (SCO1/SenC/PrrC family)